MRICYKETETQPKKFSGNYQKNGTPSAKRLGQNPLSLKLQAIFKLEAQTILQCYRL